MAKISLKKFIDKYTGVYVDVPWANGSLKGQCVSLVQIYLHECWGIELKPRGNGNQYCQAIVNAGLGYYVDTPQRGDIINYDTVGDSNPYGHVAIVANESQVFEQWVKWSAHLGSIYQNQKRLYVVRLYGDMPADEEESWQKMSDVEIANQILYGNNIWGNNPKRKNMLGTRYEGVQNEIERILNAKNHVNKIEVGEHVRVKRGAKDSNRGIYFADWVYESEFIVMSVDAYGNLAFGNGVTYTGEAKPDDLIEC